MGTITAPLEVRPTGRVSWEMIAVVRASTVSRLLWIIARDYQEDPFRTSFHEHGRRLSIWKAGTAGILPAWPQAAKHAGKMPAVPAFQIEKGWAFYCGNLGGALRRELRWVKA